jgi:hypothetical protein
MSIRLDEIGGTDWSDGDILTAADLNDSMLAILESGVNSSAEISYKTLEASGSFTNGDSLAAEQYTVAAGLNATVNTGSTTAVFNTDLYECAGGAGAYFDSEVVCDTNTLPIDSETNAFALHWQGDFPTGTSGSFDIADPSSNAEDAITVMGAYTARTDKRGVSFTPNTNVTLTSVKKDVGCDSTTAYLTDTSGTIIETQNFVGDYATFTSNLTAGTEYLIVSDSAGASYTSGSKSISYPISGTNVTFNYGIYNSITITIAYAYNIETITTQNLSAVIINLPVNTITKKTGVVSKGSLTNVDNVVIKQKLATTDTSVTPTAKGWGITKL